MLSKLLLAMFMSISLRTSNVPDQPVDYEYAGGLKTETTEMSGYRERENGIVYDGFNYRKSEKYFYSDIIYKEAQGIDSQAYALKLPIKKYLPEFIKTPWEFGVGINSQKWNHGRPMVIMQYADGIVDISYQIASNRQIIDSKVSEKIPLEFRSYREQYLNFYIEPLVTYHYELIDQEKKDYWQAKLLVGYKFGK